MNLQPYVEAIQNQLEAAADASGDDARTLARRLVLPLGAAIRLALQDALTVAAEEITCELAPGSVELHVRGRELEFVVSHAAIETAGSDQVVHSQDGEEGGMSRINLRLPDHIKTRIERDADSQQMSVNAWLVRASTAALDRGDGRSQDRRASHGAQRYRGWAR